MPDRLTSRRSATSDESNPYWISFADIMAAILVIFILAVVMLVLQLQQRQKLCDGDFQPAIPQHEEKPYQHIRVPLPGSLTAFTLIQKDQPLKQMNILLVL